MGTIKKIVKFFATIIVFIGAWKLFPENIKATSYGDCVLAAIVFMIAGIFLAAICVSLTIWIYTRTSINVKPNIITILLYIILFVTHIPLSILIATYFIPYAIVGKKAFVLLWIVLGLININIESKDENVY